MIKAIFVAPTFEQASYWAVQWGFKSNEWSYANIEDRQKIYGFYKPDFPAYICGTSGPTDEVWHELESRGFRVIDAETLET